MNPPSLHPDLPADGTAAVPQPSLTEHLDGATVVLLIRHGRSADVIPGSDESADPPLHVIGIDQAARLAARLSTLTFDAVYASHLRRAVQTAEPLAIPRGLVIREVEDLEEVRLGEWGRGEFRRRAAARDPEWLAWSRTGRWDGIPGGEGDDAFRTRVVDAVQTIAAAHHGGRVAIVVHGGTINAYLASVLGNPRTQWLSVENTSVTAVRITEDGPHVVVAGDCHHLYDPLLGPPDLR